MNTVNTTEATKPQTEKNEAQHGFVVRSQVRAGFSMGIIQAGVAKVKQALSAFKTN